jgi:hypothetical protein
MRGVGLFNIVSFISDFKGFQIPNSKGFQISNYLQFGIFGIWNLWNLESFGIWNP